MPRSLDNRKQLTIALSEDVLTYNKIRPQFSLQGNTPKETFYGKSIDINTYKTHFKRQKMQRKAVNQQNVCRTCDS